jgi:hypothetical protein
LLAMMMRGQAVARGWLSSTMIDAWLIFPPL